MKYFSFFICLLIWFCSSSDSLEVEPINEPTVITYDWIVPNKEVIFDFSPFPLAENPELFLASETNFSDEDTKVVIISFDDEIRIYPFNSVHQFEAVNDTIQNNKYAITFCPITQSTIALNRKFDSKVLKIRASGHLYKENLVLYDISSNTFWSQMKLLCIKGIYQTQSYTTFNLIETTWKTAKKYFPNALVFTNKSIISKNRPQTKSVKIPENDEVIYGVIESAGKSSKVYAYSFNLFNNTVNLYTENIGNKEIIVVGNKELNFITSYINNEQVKFSPIQNEFPIIMEDSNGNTWNVFGVSTSGPRKGEQLNSPKAFFALWWAWESFYPTINLIES